jgi:hypothetical protein
MAGGNKLGKVHRPDSSAGAEIEDTLGVIGDRCPEKLTAE